VAATGPRVLGVYETVLYSSDVPETARFYAGLPGVRLLGEPDDFSAALRLENGSVLLIFDPRHASKPGRGVPSHGAAGPGHVAFSVEAGTLDAFAAELRSRGLEIEREITWDRGGRSFYVRDPAGNSVEFVEGEAWPSE
jgi:catechol 2,3-dioxygenase-like lactoylglutathione lyase family enzyme